MLFKALSYEITPVEGTCAYNAETFIALLAGELGPTEEDRLAAHLAICPSCAKEFAYIKKSLQQETEQLTARARSPSLASQMKAKKEKGAFRYLRHTLRSMLPVRDKWMRGAMVIALTGLVVTLFLVVQLHHPSNGPAPTTQADGQMVAKGDSTITSSSTAIVSELTPALLVERLDSMSEYEAWRATAFVIGYLRAAGVPLDSPSLAFEHQTTYTTLSSDTWQSVAHKTLGDAGLWPIIILLNHNRTEHGEFPPVGTILRVPASAKGSKG